MGEGLRTRPAAERREGAVRSRLEAGTSGSGAGNRAAAMTRIAQKRKARLSAGLRQTLPTLENLERAKGFEPSTPTLARSCSTTELHPHPRDWRRCAPATRRAMPNAARECNSRRRIQGDHRRPKSGRKSPIWPLNPGFRVFCREPRQAAGRRAAIRAIWRTSREGSRSAHPAGRCLNPKSPPDLGGLRLPPNRLKFPRKPPSG